MTNTQDNVCAFYCIFCKDKHLDDWKEMYDEFIAMYEQGFSERLLFTLHFLWKTSFKIADSFHLDRKKLVNRFFFILNVRLNSALSVF